MILITRAFLTYSFGVYIKALDFWKLPYIGLAMTAVLLAFGLYGSGMAGIHHRRRQLGVMNG